MITPLGRGLRLALVVALMAGCTYRGEIDQPITIKLTWFSYLNGDDIRAACLPGTPPYYRLVYNGNYEEQLRLYEVVGDGAGGAYYKARVHSGRGLDLSRLSFADPQAMARWTTSQARLGPAELAAFEAALEASGAFEAPPDGLRLASEQFYWIAALCRAGRFRLTAWLYPSARFAGLRFPQALLQRDGTGIALNPPREVLGIERVRRTSPPDTVSPHFDIQIGKDGLVGHHPLL